MAEHATEILNTISEDSKTLSSFVESIVSRFESGDFVTTKGISFLDLKNATLLNYLTDLCVLVLNKCNGKKLENSAVVDRLVENRVVIEKIRPISDKLKYQIDKLVRIAKTDASNENDPLSLKPKPENLDVDDDENDAEEGEYDDENEAGSDENGDTEELPSKSKSKVYVPPKVAAMRYSGDETLKDKKKKLLERAKKRAMSSSLIQELRGEFDEGPEEVSDFSSRRRYNKEVNERKKYEEDYFTRLNMPKKKQHKNLLTVSSLSDDITKFEDISALEVQNVENFDEKKRKRVSEKQKIMFSKKKGKRFRRK